ncbi:MAG: succinate dehydrogenase/fumarate reductase iron-sulfur subunit [Candidatus Solibacter usitatus]|nr:succinate dehydrogenase/fumarate reductase iron-sulfur subunit [Candidatus Solibacter usitatus]
MAAIEENQYRVRVARSASSGIATEFAVVLEERMTVLDALFSIQRNQDASLSFRCACRVGMCGTCAVNINGVPRLACRTRVKTLGTQVVSVQPLPNLPVIKDLVVSLEPFFAQWKKIKPALRPKDPASKELVRVPHDSNYARNSAGKRDCITCGACYGACGVKESSEEYLGPAAINRAYLRLLDPRDSAMKERWQALNEERGGIWRCHTQMNCTSVCPKGITLTDTITRLKRAALSPGQFENR